MEDSGFVLSHAFEKEKDCDFHTLRVSLAFAKTIAQEHSSVIAHTRDHNRRSRV